MNNAWIVCGDFNAIGGLNERLGGNEVTSSEILPLINCMFDCQLHNLKTMGSFYTWTN